LIIHNMADAPDIKDVGAQAYARWLVVHWVSLIGATGGFALTTNRPDSYPVVFALSVSWAIALAVAGTTRNAFLKIDPERFRLAKWEREGRVYSLVGVGGFCWLLRHTPLGWLNPWLRMTSHRSGIERLMREMNYAEGAHLVGGVITLGFAVGYVVAGHVAVGRTFALLTIVLHVYPVMVQRWNRGRILRVTGRLARLRNRPTGPR
jgi:hypothetical protein